MTVPASQPNRYTYAGNGVTTAFAYSSKFNADADLVVLLVNDTTGVETVKTLTTDYTVTGAGTSAGTVTFGTAPASGYTVVIYGDPVLSQLVDPVNGDSLDVDAVIEAPLDKLTIIARRLKDVVARSLRQPEGDTADIARLPSAVDRVSMYLAFDADGDPIASSGPTGDSSIPVSAFIETLLDDADAATARNTLGALSSAAGAVGSSNIASGAVTAIKLAGSAVGVSMVNGTLAHSRTGSAETIAIKTLAGTDPSATDPVLVLFRNVTAATGDYVVLSITAATSITIPSTATMGATNGTAFRLWVVGFNDGGTFRLGVINCLSGSNIYPLGQFPIASSTAIGTGSDSAHVFYTDSGVTSKAYAVLGYSSWESGLATAGTWGTAPTWVQLFGPGVPLPGAVIQSVVTTDGALASGTTTVPLDNTIPQQSTEGNLFLSRAITPTSAANIREAHCEALTGSSIVAPYITGALFEDSVENALAAQPIQAAGGTGSVVLHVMTHKKLCGSTSSQTVKYKAGTNSAGTTYFNGINGSAYMGGVIPSFLEVKEIMA